MEYRLIFNDVVLKDIEDAFQWYEKQQKGLGKQFVSELNDMFTLIRHTPLIFTVIEFKVRRAILRKFPFNIYFKIMMQDEIIILGIMHQKRNPSLTKKRFEK